MKTFRITPPSPDRRCLHQARGRLAGMLLLIVSLAAGLGRAAVADPESLLLLADQDYPPMTYLDGGEARGMDVDFGKALARQMKREIRIELMDWRLAQEKVLRGEADGLLGMSISEERRKQFDFSRPVFTREFGLLVRSGNMTIRNAEDLQARIVGVTPGGFPKHFLEAKPGISLALITNYQEGFGQLSAGTIDAIAADLWVAAFLMEKGRVRGIQLAGEPIATAEAAIAVQRGNAGLLEEINAAIRALQADGTVLAIRDRWRPQEMLFVSRERMRSLITQLAGVGLLILIGVLVIWVLTLKRQIHIRRKAEADLRASEERFALAVSGSTDGLWDWNVATNEVFYAKRFRELVGFSETEFPNIFASFESNLHPADRSRVLDAVADHLKQRSPYDIEYRLRTKGGPYRWFRARGQAIWNEAGQPIRMAGSISDINERHEAEAALRESEEKFAIAFHANPNAAVITRLRDARILEANNEFLHLYGLTRAQAIDRTALDLGIWGSAAEREALISRVVVEGSIRDFEKETVLPSGNRAFFLLSIGRIALHGEECLLAVSRDITERKQTEEALRENQRVLSTLLCNLPGVVYRCRNDPHWTMEFISEGCRELTGYTPEDYTHSRRASFGDLIHPDDRRAVWDKVQAALRERRFFEHTYRLRLAGGLEKWVWERGLGIYAADGSLLALEGFITDITARHRAETERAEALQRIQQAREGFTRQLLTAQERERKRLASELHDSLGQNLSIVKNRLHFARQIPGTPEAVLAHLDAIERVTAEAIAETRSLARNLRPLHIEQIGLTDSLKGLIQEVSQSTDIRFERRVEPLDEVLRSEAATHVYRIVQEALNNLVKHSRATSAAVTIERDVRSVRLSIRDDGVGFDTRQHPATGGLGLTSLNERARILGGSMNIESTPGKGTRLEFQIPIQDSGEDS